MRPLEGAQSRAEPSRTELVAYKRDSGRISQAFSQCEDTAKNEPKRGPSPT